MNLHEEAHLSAVELVRIPLVLLIGDGRCAENQADGVSGREMAALEVLKPDEEGFWPVEPHGNADCLTASGSHHVP